MRKGKGVDLRLNALLDISFLCQDWMDELRGLRPKDIDPMKDEASTFSQMKCGGIIQRYPEGIRMKSIAALLHITPGAATQMITTLVKAGLAERFTEVNDRRSVYVRMSKRGAGFVAARYYQFQKVVKSLLTGIEEKDLDVFLTVLLKISSRIMAELDTAARK